MKYEKGSSLEKIIDAFIHEKQLEKIEEKDVLEFLDFAGFHGILADSLAKSIVGWYDFFTEPKNPHDLKTAFSYGLDTLNYLMPEILFQQQERQGQNPPIREIHSRPPVVVPGQGTVRRAKVGEDELDGEGGEERPHIYLWFERDPDSPCKEYDWYQFVNLEIHVDGEDQTNELEDKSIIAGTGLRVKFGEWNPDYQKKLVENLEKILKTKFPKFNPPELGLPRRKSAKPYYTYPLPGTNGIVGLDDAPNWGERGRDGENGDNEKNALEKMWHKLDNRYSERARTKPSPGTEIVEIVMNYRSYLVCIDTMECVGYVSWRYICRETINYDWKLGSNFAPSMDLNPVLTWTTYITGTSTMEYILEVGDWVPC